MASMDEPATRAVPVCRGCGDPIEGRTYYTIDYSDADHFETIASFHDDCFKEHVTIDTDPLEDNYEVRER